MPTDKEECPCHNCRGRLRDARTIKKHRERVEQQQISQPRLGNSQIPSGPGNGMPNRMPTTLPPALSISPHQSEQSSSMFSHAGTISIRGGNFLQQNTQTISSLSGPGLSLLRERAFPAAMHDAADRDPPPRCAEGTRIKVLSDIMKWIEDPDPRETVLWMNGPFGNGKTAIMQKVAETLSSDPQLRHLLAGSFFFGRGKPGRDKAEYLVPTIAYQIAINFPYMEKPIEAALSRNPTILDKSIHAQLRYLITEPFHLALNSPPSQRDQSRTSFHTPTVIIDGLDECEGRDSQRLILSAISDAVFKDQIRLRFLIASRPEPQIYEIFFAQPFHQRHYPILLEDDFETHAELLQHLRTGFEDICKRKLDLMYSVQKPWPSEEDISTLAYRASGQFLYAATVLRFVGSDDTHPVRQLQLILTRQPGSVTAFSSMDDLYSQILRLCPCQETLPSLLRSLVFFHNVLRLWSHHNYVWTQANLEIIAGLQAEDIAVVLRGLRAVVVVERVEEHEMLDGYSFQDFIRYYSPTIYVHHQSFIEFLTDKARSGKFFVDVEVTKEEVTDRVYAFTVHCLLQRELSLRHTIHSSTWTFVQLALRMAQCAVWPRLQIFLLDLKNSWDSYPSRPSLEFFDSLSVVCQVLRSWQHLWSYDRVRTVNIKQSLDACTSIFDVAYHKAFPSIPTSTTWKIAGAASLPHRGIDSNLRGEDVVTLGQIMGFSVQKIIEILNESRYFFDITAFRSGQRHLMEFLIKPEVKQFLLDEARSRDFYFAYRSSTTLEFQSRILYNMDFWSLFRPSDTFRVFISYKWDIRPETDLRGSPMYCVLDTLYTCHQAASLRRLEMTPSNPPFQWLCRQLRILESLEEHGNLATKLQAIIDFLKYSVIRCTFSLMDLGKTIKLPPFGVLIGSTIFMWGIPNPVIEASAFYSEISFLWKHNDRISAQSHAAIAKYYTSLLLSILASRAPDGDYRKSIYTMIDNVEWERHLSQAGFTVHLQDHLLTVHYLFTKRNDLIICGDITTAMEWLPVSFLKGSLTWFRKHFNRDIVIRREDDQSEGYRDEEYQGEGFESWCEQLIAAKELATVSIIGSDRAWATMPSVSTMSSF